MNRKRLRQIYRRDRDAGWTVAPFKVWVRTAPVTWLLKHGLDARGYKSADPAQRWLAMHVRVLEYASVRPFGLTATVWP